MKASEASFSRPQCMVPVGFDNTKDYFLPLMKASEASLSRPQCMVPVGFDNTKDYFLPLVQRIFRNVTEVSEDMCIFTFFEQKVQIYMNQS